MKKRKNPDELFIPKDSVQGGRVKAGTRSIHAFYTLWVLRLLTVYNIIKYRWEVWLLDRNNDFSLVFNNMRKKRNTLFVF